MMTEDFDSLARKIRAAELMAGDAPLPAEMTRKARWDLIHADMITYITPSMASCHREFADTPLYLDWLLAKDTREVFARHEKALRCFPTAWLNQSFAPALAELAAKHNTTRNQKMDAFLTELYGDVRSLPRQMLEQYLRKVSAPSRKGGDDADIVALAWAGRLACVREWAFARPGK
jgi:hypothetical protein